MSANGKFYFKPAKGEYIETSVFLEEDDRSAIYGTVWESKSKPMEDALVCLFKAKEEGSHRPVSCQFTDCEGHFFFGPLESDILYVIKIYKDNVKFRELEISPD